MATPQIVKNILKDIQDTVTVLRKEDFLRDDSGISVNQGNQNVWEISYHTKNNFGKIIFDNNITYYKLIDELLKNRQYTVLLYDKSIIQAEFLVKNNQIIKERLVFIKKHNIIWDYEYIKECEGNDEPWFENENGVPILFRIDYDSDSFAEVEHPKTHFTLSNHESCRIPIKGIVTFSEFIKFIMKNFYKKDINISQYRYEEETITDAEKKLIHLNWQ